MPSRSHDEISHAEQFMNQGEYKEALRIVGELLRREGITANDGLVCLLLEARLHTKLGEFYHALELIDKLQQAIRGQEKQLLKVDLAILQTEIYWRTNRLEEGLLVVQLGEEIIKEMTLKPGIEQEDAILIRKGELLRFKGNLLWYKNHLDQSVDKFLISLEIFKKIGYQRGIADSLHGLGCVYWSKGDLDQALKYTKRGLTIRNQLGNQQDIAWSLVNLGCIYQWKGDLEQALDYTMQCLTIRQGIGNQQEIAHALSNLGVIRLCKGNYDQAFIHCQQSFAICQEINDQRGMAFSLTNLGEICMVRGNLEQSLEFFQQSLEISRTLHNEQTTAYLLISLAIIYQLKGERLLALENYQESLAIYEGIGNDPSKAVILYHLIRLLLEMKDQPLVERYLQELQDIHSRTDNRVINHRYLIAKALSLSASKRGRDKLRAQEILEQVVDDEVADHSLTVAAMVYLSHLLLLELKMTGEGEVLQQVKDLTQQLFNIAESQKSHSILVETLILQSKFSVMEFEVDQAKDLLLKAKGIAADKGLQTLVQTIEKEQEQLVVQLDIWERTVEGKPSRQEQIEATLTEDILERMIRKTFVIFSEQEKRILGEEIPKKKYKIVHLDLLQEKQKIERSAFRIGIAQIGLSESGELLHEFYSEYSPGLFGCREDKINLVRSKLKNIVKEAFHQGIDLLLFPELTIDLGHPQLLDDILQLAQVYQLHMIPGSYHDPKTKRNLSMVISPDGLLWQQEKHIPAMIHFEGERLIEGIDTQTRPRRIIIGNTELGRIAIVICRDFLDMDLRVELKNCEPPIDILINPAFTPVTADFKAAHFDARRSIYAYCFFANVAEFGDSFIFSPEKERIERNIPAGEENLIYKDVDLFQLRSERRKWEIEQKKIKSFIQSTR